MEKTKELWFFQITVEDELSPYNYPNFEIKVRTKEEMKTMIKSFFDGGYHVKVNHAKKMTNADWLYMKQYIEWWNDQNLITPDCQTHH